MLSDLKAQLQLIPQQVHRPQKRHGIGAAGNGAYHRITRLHHLIALHKSAQFIQHASTPGQQTSDTEVPTAA